MMRRCSLAKLIGDAPGKLWFAALRPVGVLMTASVRLLPMQKCGHRVTVTVLAVEVTFRFTEPLICCVSDHEVDADLTAFFTTPDIFPM